MAQKFVTNLDLNQNQILNASFEVLASNPESGNFEGRMIYNSTTDSILVYGNGAWRKVVNSITSGGSYTDAITISESNGVVTLTLNLADVDSAGLLSSTFWSLLNGATDAATGSTLAKRDSNAQIKVAATPTDNAHAASKGYVDSAIAGATVSTEAVQDIVGGQFVTNGSHTGITASYDDAGDGAIDLSLNSAYSPTFAGMTLNGDLVFEGSSADANETTITVTDPTQDRTITIPNASGTVALLGSIALGTDTTGNYVSGVTAGTGVSVTHTPGEGSSAEIAIGQAVGTTDSPTFNNLNLGGSIVFEGSSADEYETTLQVTDPTADRTITLPNVSGTVITTGNLSSITSVGTLDSLTITGDLTVNGTTTTVNSTTVTVDDKNLELGSTATPSDAGADGGGITLKGTTDKTFNWVDATDAWTSSEHLNLASGKAYYINGTQVLSGSTLGSGVTSSSLTSVGTIATGVWNGTTIAIAYGGTGATSASDARTNLAETSSSGRTTSAPVLARIANQGCAASVAGTSTTTVVHNFGTASVVVEVFEVSSGATVVADVVRTDTNTVTVTMLGTISANDYKIVVTG